ncbi:MAG: TolB family protein, partial [Pseudobdellovibrionaceae bacterium]
MKIKFLSFLSLVIFSASLFPCRGLSLEVPSEWKFKKISTEHFDVIYNAEQQELGELYAQQIEKAFSLLSPLFSVQPAKTLIVINDKTDASNGYATRLPYPHIVTYPVLPGPQESLAESGDWSLELLSHEYTHILTFEPATGVFKILRGLMGSIAAPNLLLPSWWKEGLAVEAESLLGPKGGRLKSLYQDAVLRAMAEDKSLYNYDVAQINEVIPRWPEGMRAYLFGSIFWNQAVEDYGKGIMNDLNLHHSSRVPYFIEAPAEELLKSTYEDYYKKAIAATDKRAQSQIQTLRSLPVTEVHSLPLHQASPSVEIKYSTAPAINDDGKYLAFITVDYKADRRMNIFTRDPDTKMMTQKLKVDIKKEVELLAPTNNKDDGPPSGSIQKVSWFHHSPKLIYDQLHYINRTERYSDLYIYDIDSGKNKRLTTALRAREPSVSPNDEKVVFVKLEGGRTQLGLYDLASDKAEILYSPAFQERISSPIFLDAHTLVFALRDRQGAEGLWTYSFADKKIAPILTDFEQARFPVLTKKGLMFTSSKNGVHNLYLANSSLKAAKPLTHVLTMVTSAALDPESESIYATYMSSTGPAVVMISKDEWQKTPSDLPHIQGLFADRFKDLLTPAPGTPAVTETPGKKFEVMDYSPGEYLWPQYWIPYFWTSPEGGLVFQVQTSGFDPLKKHNYDLSVDWNTYLEAFDWSASYLNNVTSLPVEILGAQTHSYLVTRDNLLKDTLASIAALPDIWSLNEKLSLGLGWRYLERSLANTGTTSATSKRTGPFASLSYKNITQGGDQFTPQEGGGAYLMAFDYIEGAGLMAHSQFQAGGVFYYSESLPKLHALVLRGSVLYTPEKISPLYGTQSDSMDFSGQDLAPKFLARGYSTGQFLGRNMYNVNLEYRFPVKDLYQGKGTYALFMRRLYAALITDGIATDGYAYNVNSGFTQVSAGESFWSYGIETHLETTVGYEFPLNFVL